MNPSMHRLQKNGLPSNFPGLSILAELTGYSLVKHGRQPENSVETIMNEKPSGNEKRSEGGAPNTVVADRSGSRRGHSSGKNEDSAQPSSRKQSTQTEQQRAAIEGRIDEALEESFPASDPPACYKID